MNSKTLQTLVKSKNILNDDGDHYGDARGGDEYGGEYGGECGRSAGVWRCVTASWCGGVVRMVMPWWWRWSGEYGDVVVVAVAMSGM